MCGKCSQAGAEGRMRFIPPGQQQLQQRRTPCGQHLCGREALCCRPPRRRCCSAAAPCGTPSSSTSCSATRQTSASACCQHGCLHSMQACLIVKAHGPWEAALLVTKLAPRVLVESMPLGVRSLCTQRQPRAAQATQPAGAMTRWSALRFCRLIISRLAWTFPGCL